MSEANQEGAEAPNASNANRAGQEAWFSNWLREGADRVRESFAPPDGAANHFREARLEILRGIRELIDYRIERLSRTKSKGGRIVVE